MAKQSVSAAQRDGADLNLLWCDFRALLDACRSQRHYEDAKGIESSDAALVQFLETHQDKTTFFLLDLARLYAGSTVGDLDIDGISFPQYVDHTKAKAAIKKFRDTPADDKDLNNVRPHLIDYYANSLEALLHFRDGEYGKAAKILATRDGITTDDHYRLGVMYQTGGKGLKANPKRAIENFQAFLTHLGRNDTERVEVADRIYAILHTYEPDALRLHFRSAVLHPRTGRESLKGMTDFMTERSRPRIRVANDAAPE